MSNATAIQEIEPTFPIAATMEQIERIEGRLLDLPQVEMPVTNLFAPGVYYREFFVPKGTFVIGHQHKTEHFNIMLQGKMKVLMDGKVTELVAPCVFVSRAGLRKMAYVTEDMRFVTIHPLAGLEHCGQDVDLLEDELRVKSKTFIEHEMKQLKNGGKP